MKVLLYGIKLKEKDLTYIDSLLELLSKQRIEVFFYKPVLESLVALTQKNHSYQTCSNQLDLKEIQPDFVLTLGGDGTILSAITLIAEMEIPVLGVNLGRLGFLASTEKSHIEEAINMLKNGMYHIEKRSLIYLESNMPLFGNTRFALNDFTLHKRDTSSMITIHTYVNGDLLNSYWADGLIVATPTGSTGYSLSCGGPIIFPNSGNFVITPVAPHNLNVRPIVLSDEAVISFEIEGRADNFLCTMDSRYETISSKHQLAVRKCDFDVHLVQLNTMTFLKTLQNKLTWGKDSRN